MCAAVAIFIAGQITGFFIARLLTRAGEADDAIERQMRPHRLHEDKQ